MPRLSVVKKVLLQDGFLAAFVILVGAFSWYFPLHLFFQSTLEELLPGYHFLAVAVTVQYTATVVSAIIGTELGNKFQRPDTFLSFWMLLGIIASISIVAMDPPNLASVSMVSFLLGISLGLGFPSCLAYFSYSTDLENRGLLAGITFFVSCLCMFFIAFLLTRFTLLLGALTLAIWRGLSLLLFLLSEKKRHASEEKVVKVSYTSVLSDRSFLLYLLPWSMFCLINFLEHPVLTNFFGNDFAELMPIAEFGIGGFAALIGGWFADSVGRKRVIIFGFIMLGIGYAVLGLFSGILLSWYLYLILDGVAWGIFSLMFYMVVWAELAKNRTREKYYLFGVLPFILASFIQILFAPYADFIPVSAAFSLASFFLFLSVLPLVYAPETLPERKIELRKLRRYVEKARKTKEKREDKD